MSDFDELLDEVLREDASAHPRTGLEGRVMARIRGDGQRRSMWRFVTWGVVAAALPVCVVALLVWPKSLPTVQHVNDSPAIAASAIPEKVDLEPTRSARLKGVPKILVRHEHSMDARELKSLPKLNVFPSLAPVDIFPQPVKANEGERQLAELTSKEVGEALAALHQEQNEPIRIAAIEITPIQMDRAEGRDR